MAGCAFALENADFLGFDNAAQAGNAILRHSDWQSRFDIDEADRGPIRAWRELRLKQERAQNSDYQSSHWSGTPNVLAHTRVDDRTTASGEKGLFVNEVQSDWHQTARKSRENEIKRLIEDERIRKDEPVSDERKKEIAKSVPDDFGYKGSKPIDTTGWTAKKVGAQTGRPIPDTAPTWDIYGPDGLRKNTVLQSEAGTEAEAIAMAARNLTRPANRSGVPTAPFQKNWHEFVMRRMLAEAVEKGYDHLLWATGDQSNDLYDLSKSVKRIEYDPRDKTLVAFPHGESTPIVEKNISPEKLADYIGKDPAERLLAQPLEKVGIGDLRRHVLEGDDLKVGGSGMRGFYDKMIPDYMRRLVKKWGGKVEDVPLPTGKDEVGMHYEGPTLTLDEAWAKLKEVKQGDEWRVNYAKQAEDFKSDMQAGMSFKEAVERQSINFARFMGGENTPYDKPIMSTVHGVKITPEMRESLLADGQPLFARRPKETDTQYDKRTEKAIDAIRRIAAARGQKLVEPAPRKAEPAKAEAPTKPEIAPVPAPKRSSATTHVPGERSFPKTAEASGFTGGTDRDYTVITDKDSLAHADRRIARLGLDHAKAELRGITEPTKHDGAMGILLIQKYEKAGKLKEAVEVANDLSRKYTQAGQFVQSAAIITRLSPEGVLMAAQKRMQGGRTLPEETAKTVVAQAKEITAAEELVTKIRAARPDIFGPNGEILPRTTAQNITRDTNAQPVTRKRARERIGKLQDRLTKMEADARARIAARYPAETKTKGPEAGAGLNPVVAALEIKDLAIIGAAKLARKGIDRATWLAEMADEFKLDRPSMRKLYRESDKEYEAQRQQFLQESRERGAEKRAGKPLTREERQAAINEHLDAMTAARKARSELARTFRDLNATPTRKVIRNVRDVWDLSRSLITSVDLSAGGRQAKMALVSHPQTFAEGFVRQFKALKTSNYERMISEMQSDPDYKYAQRFKLDLTSSATTRGEHEEQYQSEFTHKLPWIKHSEQAYNTMLDTVRMGWFKHQLKAMRAEGLDPENPEHKPMFEAQAALINNFNGRGGGKRLKAAAPLINSLAFSGRFWASRLRVLTLPLDPRMYGKPLGDQPAYSKAVRRDAWKSLLGFYGLTASTLAIAKLTGADVNLTNPDDPDWLKAKWGKVHVDFSAGLQGHLRVAARLAKLLYMREYQKDKPRTGPRDIGEHYLRSKLAPNPALLYDLFGSDKKAVPNPGRGTGVTTYGTNVVGEPVMLTGEKGKGTLHRIKTSAVAQRAIPIVLQDVMDAYDEGLSKTQATAATIGSIFGEGVTTYTPKPGHNAPVPPPRRTQPSP